MPLSQPHADTIEPDGTGPDTDKMCLCVCVFVGAGMYVCVCVSSTVRSMKDDGAEVDYRGKYKFLATLV